MRTPTSSETTTVRDSRTRSVVGRSMPKATNSEWRSIATRKPPAMPAIEPSRPIATASTITVVRICGREAPSVRSRPNSVTRWATVIEKVLKIRKAPTKTAMIGEDEQERLQEAEVVADFGGGAIGVFLRRLDPHRFRHLRLDAALQHGRRDAVGGGDRDLVEATNLVGDPLGDGQGDLGDAGAAEGGASELGEADEAEVCAPGSGRRSESRRRARGRRRRRPPCRATPRSGLGAGARRRRSATRVPRAGSRR